MYVYIYAYMCIDKYIHTYTDLYIYKVFASNN